MTIPKPLAEHSTNHDRAKSPEQVFSPITTFLHRHYWWVLLSLLVLAAAGLRFASFDFGLPYVEHLDEPNYYLAGQEWRGLFDNQGYYQNVPPGYIIIHTVAQPILEVLGISGLAPTIAVMRGLSVLANLITLVFIALTARLAAGHFAGLIAGASWAFSPLVLENGVYALPDPLLYLLAALSLWLAAHALLTPDKRAGWVLWSTIASLLAIIIKYTVVPLLLPGVMAALWLTRQQSKYTRYLLLQTALIAVVGVWLVFVYGVDFNNLQREGSVVQQSGLANMLDINRVLHNFYQVFVPLYAPAFFAIAFLGLVAWVIADRWSRLRIKSEVVVLCLALVIAIPWVISSFSFVQPAVRIRDVMPATVAACVLLGVAAAQIIYLLPRKQQRWGILGLMAALSITIFIPHLRADWNLVQERRLPDRRVALRQWFDTNLEPGTVLVDSKNHKTFNPFWGGIPYRHWFDWWEVEDFTGKTPAEWREENGISYGVFPASWVETMQQTTGGQAYLAQMLHLRDFIHPPEMRGPEVRVYRLWSMQHPLAVNFGSHILLKGYDRDSDTVSAGGSLSLRFYWQAVTTPPDNYSLFVHLVPASEYTVLAQVDGAPAMPDRPTLTWNDPTETLISPQVHLTIPADLEAGTYRIFVGLYNYLDGQRLALETGEDTLLLTKITVTD